MPEQQMMVVDENGQPIQENIPQSPIYQSQDTDIIKYQLDSFEDTVSRFMRVFRGELYDPDQGKWIPGKRAMMNDFGISEISSFIIQSKHILLSSYTEKELYRTLRAILNTITRMVTNSHDPYGIRDTATAESVMDIIYMHLQAILLAAKDGQMRIYFQKQIRETHNYNVVTQNNSNKKRFGGFI